MSHTHRCVRALRLVVLAVLATLPLPSAPGQQGTDPLQNLPAVLADDLAAGFAAARDLYNDCYRRGDLDGMARVIRAVADHAKRSLSYGLVEDMIDLALPVAHERADWKTLGDLYHTRATLYVNFAEWGLRSRATNLRTIASTRLAEEAYARGGETPQAFIGFRQYMTRAYNALAQSEDQQQAGRARRLGEHFQLFLNDIEAAIGEGRDADAVAMMHDYVADALAERDQHVSVEAAAAVSHLIWVRGGDSLVPSLRRLLDERAATPDDAVPVLDGIASSCAFGWSGGEDGYYQAYLWAFEALLELGASAAPLEFAQKATEFGLSAERDRLLWAFLTRLREMPVDRWRAAVYADRFVHEDTPPDLRRLAVYLLARSYLSSGTIPSETGSMFEHFVRRAPAGQEAVWLLETAYDYVDAAYWYDHRGSRARLLATAAGMFADAERPDLAAHTRMLAQVAASESGEPSSLILSAFAAAQCALGANRWDEAVARLQPVAGLVESHPCRSSLEAAMMLQRAYRELGDSAAATRWLATACRLIDSVDLDAGERADKLMTLAENVDDLAARTAMLRSARQAAGAAGLDLLQGRIADALAEAAFLGDDLDAAEAALLEVVKRQESTRESLAFDPLLRQQWFARNLAPYRKLLTVAALKGDAALALSCGERMRARVLADQLAWQKVDLGVDLAPELQARLAGLRELRRQAYALLQRSMGGSSGEGRGLYMPIRGADWSARGDFAVDGSTPAPDPAELRRILGQVAREEAAVESVIREEVPAYRAAASTAVPSAADLVAAVARTDGLAVIEYTFSHDGLVGVGMGPHAKLRVVRVPLDRQEIRSRIEAFREALRDPNKPPAAPARTLYRSLVSPFEECMVGATRCLIVGDGVLQLIPFGALIDGQGRYLVERLAIGTTPSLTLAMSERPHRSPAQQAGLIVAAPDTGGVSAPAPLGDERGAYMPIRGGDGVSGALRSLATVALPGARLEGERLAQIVLGSKLLTGPEATKARVLQAGGDCDLLHIATHGYADPEVPELSGLLLAGADGRPYDVLTAQEVYLWPLTARLVTLSACETGLGKTVEGEGLLGLVRSFLYAGAQDVVCSLWSVQDESTAKLMQRFYKQLADGTGLEESLASAQRSLRADEATEHPFYWAAFVPVRGPQ